MMIQNMPANDYIQNPGHCAIAQPAAKVATGIVTATPATTGGGNRLSIS